VNPTPAESRSRALDFLGDGVLDVLVIGGGIVGAGVARDAAMRGLRTGLAEQGDFASGTSGRSSRLLHGGLRYLPQGRLGLVRQASIEKGILHRIAPHLCEPLAFVFPAYRGTGWPLWQLRLGVKIYDLLCGGRNFGPSGWMAAESVRRQFPQLQGDQLTGAARYFDALTNDARLVLDTLRSAAASGAAVVNYFKFNRADFEGCAWACELEDRLAGRTHRVKTRAVVNATGPWAQVVPHSHVRLRLTKGAHVVVDRRRLAISEAVVMTDRGRILFAIPWVDRVILGTTDTDYSGPAAAVGVEQEEVDCLLGVAGKFFPVAGLSEADVISGWAGLRPLIASGSGRPSDISRAHQIRSPEPGWWDVAGGKLTTYRLMAEQTVNEVVRRLALRSAPCRTAQERLLASEETDGLSSIGPPLCERRVVEHFCRHEWAARLEDVMVRRTGWHNYDRDTSAKAEVVAEWMAQIQGWTAETKNRELKAYRELSRR
jgi:glycerol-3-phosphate dehydrogenase